MDLNQVPGLPSQLGPGQSTSLPPSQSASPIHISGYSASQPGSPAQSRTPQPAGYHYGDANQMHPGHGHVPPGMNQVPQNQMHPSGPQHRQSPSPIPPVQPNQMPPAQVQPVHQMQPGQIQPQGQAQVNGYNQIQPAAPETRQIKQEAAQTVDTVHGSITSASEAPTKKTSGVEDLPLPPGYSFTHPDPPATTVASSNSQQAAKTSVAGISMAICSVRIQ